MPDSISDAVAAILTHNAGREPERLAMKYAKMARSPFVFLRGTCHLFYAALPATPLFSNAPPAWCCGDLHFENFGSYKGDNRLVYFDINDFDEAALAPSTWDMARLLTSIQCGADQLRATRAQALAVSKSCVLAYQAALANGKPLWVERDTSVGLVNVLLADLQQRSRPDFLDKRTVIRGSSARRQRELRLDGDKALPASDDQKKSVVAFMKRFAASQPQPKFYRVLDVGRRIAGTGSLGLERFVVLVEGNGSPSENYLLELKQSLPSALLPQLARLGVLQPRWPDPASRVFAIQNRMQAVNNAFLHPVKLAAKRGQLPCLLKELQPSEDRVAIGGWGRNLDRLKEAVDTMGRVLAWDQLRSGGRAGAAGADALSAFAQRPGFARQMLDASVHMASITHGQWREFAAWHAAQRPNPD